VRLTLLFCAAAALVHGQTSAPAAGLTPSWDVAVILNEIGANAGRLLPALDKLNTKAWAAKGASDTYTAQWQSCRDQARALEDGAKALAKNPERLSPSLELYFRTEGLDQMLTSLEDAARKYQDAQAAEAVASTWAEGAVNRGRFRTYIVDLAADRERQLEVMDQEAQRCRNTLMAPTTAGRKK
jgi:hypothetical protein